jgi:anti-sigma B factor antagonist
MKLLDKGDVLTVTDVKELGANNSDSFRDEVKAALPNGFKTVEIDLSQTSFIDSCGLGALIAIQKFATGRNGSVSVRLLNPLPAVQQLFELTRLHRMFEIVRRDTAEAAA